MKSKHNLYILVVISFTIFSSCKKDSLLNLTPPTSLAENAYWNTVSDLQNYMNNFYSKDVIFPHYRSFSSLGIYSVDDNSDNMVPQSVSSRLNGLNTVAGNSGYADWKDIYDVNYFLANYLKVKVSPADVAQYLGEAYFFRALLYFQGVENYGALPWINKPLNINDTALIYAPRLPRNVIIDSVIKDLDSAVALLPTKGKAGAQRVYKEFAEGYKARICLFEGTWEKYHANDAFGVSGQDGTNYIQLAAAATDSVMNSGLFQLDNIGEYDSYFNLFNQTDYSNSKEIMFWGAYSQQQGITTYWQNYYQEGSDGTNSDGLSKSLVDDYLCTDGKPISVSSLYKGDDSLADIVANRDPRLRKSMFINGDTVISNVPGSSSIKYFTYPALLAGTPCTTGFQIRKGLNTDFYQDSHNGPGGTDGVIYMRYAEILLIYAEAKAELGTITQQDVDETINKLRDRVGMPHLEIANIPNDPNWAFPNLSPIINEVRRERRVELAYEGFRLFDILRWAAASQLLIGKQPLGAKANQFATVIPDLKIGTNVFVNNQGYILPYANTTSMSAGYQFNVNRDYLLPISLQEITVNSKIQQNPGW